MNDKVVHTMQRQEGMSRMRKRMPEDCVIDKFGVISRRGGVAVEMRRGPFSLARLLQDCCLNACHSCYSLVAYGIAVSSWKTQMTIWPASVTAVASRVKLTPIIARGAIGLAGAPSTVDLSTKFGALAAITGNARVEAAGGAFTGTTVITRTGLKATTGQCQKLSTVSVTAGVATLTSGGHHQPHQHHCVSGVTANS